MGVHHRPRPAPAHALGPVTLAPDLPAMALPPAGQDEAPPTAGRHSEDRRMHAASPAPLQPLVPHASAATPGAPGIAGQHGAIQFDANISIISTALTSQVTPGAGNYASTLTITASGSVIPTAAGVTAIYSGVAGVSLVNQGSITGGAGGHDQFGYPGAGGTGVALGNGTLINHGAIVGGAGGANSINRSGDGGTGVSVTDGTVSNDGSIYGGAGGVNDDVYANTGAGGTGVSLGSGMVLNEGVIGGGDGSAGELYRGGAGGTGVSLGSTAWLTNTGTVTGGAGGAGYANYFNGGSGGAGGAGVVISGGGATNYATITGGEGGAGNGGNGGAGVYLNGGTLINAGTISGGAGNDGGANGDAVQFGSAAGTLTIDPGAVFNGNVAAQYGHGDVLELAGTTPGTLSGLGTQFTGFDTILEESGSNWTLNGQNTIGGTATIGGLLTVAGTLDVAGTLAGGVTLTAGSFITVANGGVMQGSAGAYSQNTGGAGGTAVTIAGGTLTNDGTVAGGAGGGSRYNFGGTGGTGGAGVAMSGGTFTNEGTVAGGAGGFGFYGASGDAGVAMSGGALTNDGTVAGGAGGLGLYGGSGGAGVAMSGGTLTNQAAVTGGYGGGGSFGGSGGAGVAISGATLTNHGSVTGGHGASSLYAGAGGTGVLIQAGYVGNTGNIVGGLGGGTGYGRAGQGGSGAYIQGGTLTNGGTITGGAGGDGSLAMNRSRGGAGGAGVRLDGGTLINAGTIAGGAGGTGGASNGQAGDAVQFGSAAGTLIIDPGAAFVGNVVAQYGHGDVLELAGSTAGTLSGLGTQFTGFDHFTEAAGATWTLAGANTLAGTATLDGALTVAGSLDLTGSMSVAESLVLGGSLTVASGATLAGQDGVSALYASGAGVYVLNQGSIEGGGSLAGASGRAARGAYIGNGATFINRGQVVGTAGGANSGIGGDGVGVVGASLNNYGTIAGGASGGGGGGNGVADEFGGVVTNHGLIESGGAGGVGVFLTNATLVNDGTINGEGSAAVQFAGDATLAFGQAAVFDGAITGFAMGDTLIADGTVFTSATYVNGVGLELFGGGGEVTLDLPVGYAGDYFAVSSSGGNTTIRLEALISTISTAVTTEVTLGSHPYASTLTVTGSGSVIPGQAGAIGIYDSTTGASLLNQGTIQGGAGAPVFQNYQTGGSGGDGVSLGSAAYVDNSGSIKGGAGGNGYNNYNTAQGGSGAVGVAIGSGTVVNDGSIAGGAGGRDYFGYAGEGGTGVSIGNGSLINRLAIVGGAGGGDSNDGVGSGGTGVSVTDGTVSNYGSIFGGAGGVINHFASHTGAGGTGVSLGAGMLLNAGVIGGGDGSAGQYYRGAAGGTGVSLGAAAWLTNTGTVTGGAGGAGLQNRYRAATGGAGGAGVVITGGGATNDATITGGKGGAADGLNGGSGGAGVYLNGGTLINAGTISGGAGNDGGANGDAVQFGSAAGTLTIDPGAVFNGNVAAQYGHGDVLELAGSTAGTLSGLGTQFTGFDTILEESGSNWTLTGPNTIGGAATIDGLLTVAGTLDVAGGLTVAGTLDVAGGLDVAGTVTGGVTLTAAASFITVANRGVIQGNIGGTAATMTGGTLTNDGTITGGAGGGTNNGHGGSYFSRHAGSGGTGVSLGAGTLINTGQVTGGTGGNGGNYYVYTGNGGAGITASGGTLVNDGTITGGAAGKYGLFAGNGGAGIVLMGGTLTNAGSISGGRAYYSQYSLGQGGAGVYLNGGTLITSGTIAGGASYLGHADAVQFGSAAGTLIIDPGAVFIGNVVANGGVNDVLELSGSTAETLSGLGTQFTNFSTLYFAPNATWTVQGTEAGFGATQSIEGFSSGDLLDITDLAFNGLTWQQTGDVLTLTENGSSTSLTFTGDTEPLYVTSDSNGDTEVGVACYRRGTRIATPRGDIAIENLAAGDPVLTRSGAVRPVKWLGYRTLDCTRHKAPKDVWPVRVAAGAFGDNVPARDLFLSPGHAIVHGGVLMPVSALINGVTVTQHETETVQYWHVELDSHDIILAEGLAAESYIDTGNRTDFENGGAWLELHPDFRPRSLENYCLPFRNEGAAIEAARAALLARLPELGLQKTTSPDPHIIADGTRIDPVPLGESRLAFLLPPSAKSIELCSRAFIPPAKSCATRDLRTLGLNVKRLQLDGTNLSLTDAAFTAPGWHKLERDPTRATAWRWTTGRATLPPATRLVVLDLGRGGTYWQQEAAPAPILSSKLRATPTHAAQDN